MIMAQLKKELGFGVILLLALNAILGTGIYFLPALGALYAGPASLISWIIMAVVAVFVSCYFAELVSMFPKAGGVYEFVKQSFGEVPSFIIGWTTWIIANITIAMLIVGALMYILPTAAFHIHIILSIFFILFFNYINYRGIRESAKMLIVFGFMTIASLFILIVPGSFQISLANFSPFFVFPASSIFLALFFIAETFFGWETITFLAEEVKDARKVLPKILVIATVMIALISILLTFVCLGVVNWEVFSVQKAPLSYLASVLFGSLGGKIFALLMFIPIVGTAASWIVSSPRLLFAMARDNVFISDVKKIHPKYNTPHIAIALQVMMSILVTLIAFGSFTTLLKILLPLVLMVYSFVILCVVKLRITKPKLKRYFKAPFGKVGPILIVLFNLYLMYVWLQHEPITFLLIGFLFILSGFPAYIIIKLQTDKKFVEKFWDRVGFLMDWYYPMLLYRQKEREMVINNAKINKKSIVLDYGCGCGVTTSQMADKVKKLVAADLSRNQILTTIKEVEREDKIGNIIFLKLTKTRAFPKNTFNAIVSVLSINYFVDPEKELKYLYSILKKNGVLSSLAFKAPFITTHHFLKNEGGIKQLFKKAGFKKVTVKTRKGFMKKLFFITAHK